MMVPILRLHSNQITKRTIQQNKISGNLLACSTSCTSRLSSTCKIYALNKKACVSSAGNSKPKHLGHVYKVHGDGSHHHGRFLSTRIQTTSLHRNLKCLYSVCLPFTLFNFIDINFFCRKRFNQNSNIHEPQN